MSRRHLAQGLACSFCHKSEGRVGKLISSPSDYPRAYICDECIAVCVSIIEDDAPGSPGPPYTFIHPLAGEFFSLVEDWIGKTDRGEDVSPVLDQMLLLARQIVADSPPAEPTSPTSS